MEHLETFSSTDESKIFFVRLLLYMLSVICTKQSIALQYLRLLFQISHRRMCIALIIFNITYSMGTMIGFLLSCHPVAYFWDRTIPGGYLNHPERAWYVAASCDILSDWCLIAFPFIFLRVLHIGRRQRRALMFLFALGGWLVSTCCV